MLRPIAIYLPQFHPIPENDAWWGKGFTEWTNVANAKPLYEGHYQPHVPADLGFYDLRLEETRIAQAALAREYGIYGFCYYHYWFNGKRILERPFEEVFKTGKPDFPFMLCWANENWTRVWDGGDKDILLEQVYSPEDDRNHIRSLIPYFKDHRYVKIDDKPVFCIYRSTLFPDMADTIKIWREEAAKENMELYLCRFESLGIAGPGFMEAGFDAAIEFQPQVKHQAAGVKIKTLKDEISIQNIKRSISFRTKNILNAPAKIYKKRTTPGLDGYVSSYEDYMKNALDRYNYPEKYKLYRSVCPGWDNSPRRKKGYTILSGSTPQLFGSWTRQAVMDFIPYSKEENLFFINAWNEWAEGNFMEPSQKWGKAYLNEFKKVLEEL